MQPIYQNSHTSGEHNTVVQIAGDHATVNLGKVPQLKLTRFEAAQNKPINDLHILNPNSRCIPLVGRDAEMTDLLDFVRPDSPKDIRVRVLVGGGGSGKTRLALHLCDQIKSEWNAGFVTSDALARFFNQHNASEWGWQKPTLIVVDYAAAQAAVLGPWLKELQDRGDYPYPLRILLLERHADPERGWHKEVFNRGGWQNQGLRDLLYPPEPVQIYALGAIDDRMAIVRSVLDLTAPGLAAKLSQTHTLEDEVKAAPWGGDPLYLAMAAFTMAKSGNTSVFHLKRTDLALAVADHELNRLRVLVQAKHIATDLVRHLCACITMVQGLTRAEAIEMVRSESTAIGFDNNSAPAQIVALLHEALADGDSISPVRPDLIGEALLLSAWNMPETAAAVQRLYVLHPTKVVETLVRLMQDFDIDNPRPAQWFEQLLTAYWEDLATLERIDSAVPSETVALREVNQRLAQRLLELDGVKVPELRAYRLNRLAVTHSELGQPEKALEAAQEAVVLRRELAQQRPDAFRPNLAMSLSNLASFLSALGHREKALEAAQEGVDLFRELAQQRPDAFRPELAMSLNNLANRLSALGQREKALEAAQEAVALRRELARQRPDPFRPDLAMSLNNLAGFLSALGQREKALEAAQEAVGLRREQAQQRPDTFRPNLATSLNNLANRLSELGQREKALEAAQEAVALRRELAKQRPDAFRPDLATSLIVLALRVEESENAHAGMPLAHEAILTLSPAFIQRPQAHFGLMQAMLRDYVRLCNIANTEPDQALLTPLIPVFQQFQQDQTP